jgi:hypothetical protein
MLPNTSRKHSLKRKNMPQTTLLKVKNLKSLIVPLIFALFASILYSQTSLAETLTTNNYVVTITKNCEEGNVTCDDITYRGISKQTGEAITLKGSTKHTKCADGMTPCKFIGYEFKNGNITYLVLESGLLQVFQGESEVLLEEQGKWE